MSAQDPLYDFPPESMTVYGDQAAAPSTWPVRTRPRDETDSTSRVISFVLGFALASLIAWLGSIRADRPATAPVTDAVATAGIPVVADTTGEIKHSKEPAAVIPSPETPPPVPATVESAPATPLPVVSGPVAPATPVKTVPTRVPPVAPAQPRTPSSAPPGYRGGLVLNSTPAGAEVVVNGKVVGQTPVVLNDLPVGSRALIVRRDGYSPWSTSVRIVANQRTTVQATLSPVP